MKIESIAELAGAQQSRNHWEMEVCDGLKKRKKTESVNILKNIGRERVCVCMYVCACVLAEVCLA